MLMENIRALVTGGCGFIGSHLVEALLYRNCDVIVLDDLSTGKRENLKVFERCRNLTFIRGDVRNLDLVRAAVKDVEVIFHMAAIPSVPRSIGNPLLTHEVNVTGTLNVLKAGLDAKVKRIVYASSSSVYGDVEFLPRKENMPTFPISPYGVSKLAAEQYCKAFYRVYGLPTVCLRYFNVYGPRQTYGPYSGVITIFINKALKGEPPVIYGDGEQTRDFTSIVDVVKASFLAAKNKQAVGEIFNIATGKPTTINLLARKILKLCGRNDIKPKYAPPRPGDVRFSYADISKAQKILGYNPSIELDEGLANLIEWFQVEVRK
ncbi:MAG: SDR family oxidoreductase [Candidatus Bathyarchaeia archaeon]